MTIIVFGAVYAVLLIIFMRVLHGRGGVLIVGYNALQKEERERYNEKALRNCVIWLLSGFSACIALIPAGVQLRMPWLIYIGIALAVLLPVVFVIYANTGGHFLLDGTKHKRTRQ